MAEKFLTNTLFLKFPKTLKSLKKLDRFCFSPRKNRSLVLALNLKTHFGL